MCFLLWLNSDYILKTFQYNRLYINNKENAKRTAASISAPPHRRMINEMWNYLTKESERNSPVKSGVLRFTCTLHAMVCNFSINSPVFRCAASTFYVKNITPGGEASWNAHIVCLWTRFDQHCPHDCPPTIHPRASSRASTSCRISCRSRLPCARSSVPPNRHPSSSFVVVWCTEPAIRWPNSSSSYLTGNGRISVVSDR